SRSSFDILAPLACICTAMTRHSSKVCREFSTRSRAWQETQDLFRTRMASGSEKNSVISGGTYVLGNGVDVGPNLLASQSIKRLRSSSERTGVPSTKGDLCFVSRSDCHPFLSRAKNA